MIGISIFLILANVLVSWKGFNDRNFYERYEFSVEKILLYKQYYRLVTSGFLHVNWMHLIFNMIALYFFSGSVEYFSGPLQFLLIYFASLVGGDLLSLFIHRHDSGYSSVGASGAVNGIIFAAIAVFPGMKMFFGIPAWVFGLAYVLYSIYGIRSRRNNVGHESHLAGSLIGMLACTPEVKKFVSLAGAGQPADKILTEQLSTQPPLIKDASLTIIDSLKNGFFVKNVSPFLMTLFRPSVQPYLVSWFKYDPADVISKLKIPALIIQGNNDLQVKVDDAEMLHKAYATSKLTILDSVNHVLRKVGDKNDNMKSYYNPNLPIDEKIVQTISSFITKK